MLDSTFTVSGASAPRESSHFSWLLLPQEAGAGAWQGPHGRLARPRGHARSKRGPLRAGAWPGGQDPAVQAPETTPGGWGRRCQQPLCPWERPACPSQPAPPLGTRSQSSGETEARGQGGLSKTTQPGGPGEAAGAVGTTGVPGASTTRSHPGTHAPAQPVALQAAGSRRWSGMQSRPWSSSLLHAGPPPSSGRPRRQAALRPNEL